MKNKYKIAFIYSDQVKEADIEGFMSYKEAYRRAIKEMIRAKGITATLIYSSDTQVVLKRKWAERTGF